MQIYVPKVKCWGRHIGEGCRTDGRMESDVTCGWELGEEEERRAGWRGGREDGRRGGRKAEGKGGGRREREEGGGEEGSMVGQLHPSHCYKHADRRPRVEA